MGTRSTVVGLLIVALATPAWAQIAPAPSATAARSPMPKDLRTPPPATPPEAESWHGFGMASVTALFSILTTIAGLAIGSAHCPRDTPNDGFGDDEFFCGVGAGVVIGPLVGMAVGPLLYDDLIGDGDGSLSSAYGGIVIGLAGMVIVTLATGGDGLVLGVLMPFAGAGLGYSLYAPHDARPRGFRPSLNVRTEPDGGRRVTAGVGFSF